MKTHSKIFSVVFLIFLVFTICLSGCGKNGQVDSTSNPTVTSPDASSQDADTQKDSAAKDTSTQESGADVTAAKDSSSEISNDSSDSALTQTGDAAISDASQESSLQDAKLHEVDFTFNLPAGFKWSDGFPHRIESLTGSSDGVKAKMTLEVFASAPQAQSDSQAEAAKAHALHDWPCTDGKFCPALYQMRIANQTIYVSTDYADYFWGQMTGYSSLYFNKNGVGYSITLDDLPEGQLPALQTVISSLKTK